MFEINNDLKNITFNFHNAVHLFGSMIMAALWGFGWSYGPWIAWEVSDGLKPWYYEFRWNANQSWFVNKFRQECLYSDKFSLQDALIWDLAGAVAGTAIRLLWGLYV